MKIPQSIFLWRVLGQPINLQRRHLKVIKLKRTKALPDRNYPRQQQQLPSNSQSIASMTICRIANRLEIRYLTR